MDTRAQQLADWCGRQVRCDAPALEMVSGDASFRRYFRLTSSMPTLIAMDAPPEKEDSSSFVALAKAWGTQNVRVPEVIAADLSLGFLLLEDFGDQQMLMQVSGAAPKQVDAWYQQAMRQLIHLQHGTQSGASRLPPYDEALLNREMSLFSEWLIEKQLALTLSPGERQLLQSLYGLLRDNALAQPKVSVHRDYHSRNLMCLADGHLGILDFQDAVCGPLTYDLVSLLRDCYVRWPADWVRRWCADYHDRARQLGLPVQDFTTFFKDFEWMGMQRHLKASGIFARLALRDGKFGYLQDIPNTLVYLQEAAQHYEQTRDFAEWLQARVMPALTKLESACAP